MRTIYIDENIPSQVAQALDLFERKENVLMVKSTITVFGVGATDEAIVNGMNKTMDFLVTKDSDFKRMKILTTLIKLQAVGIFHFRPPSGTKYWPQLEYLIKAWPNIREAALNEKPPFLYEFRTNGKLNQLHL